MKDRVGALDLLHRKIKLLETQPRTIISEIASTAYSKYKVRKDITLDILNKMYALDTIQNELLYKILSTLILVSEKTEILGISDGIVLEKLFTDIEIDGFKKPYKVDNTKKDTIIKEGNWRHTNIYPHNYITIFIDANELINWRDNNILRYNPETQRDIIEIESEGGKTYRLDINPEAIKSMKELMLKGEYFNVQGTLNINTDVEEQPEVKFKNGDLIIPYNAKIDLIEGYHNYLAITQAKDQDPNFNMPCEYRLYFINTSKANALINQMDRKNHLTAMQAQRTDLNNPSVFIANELSTDTGSIFKGFIDEYKYKILLYILNKIDIKDNFNRLLFKNKLMDVATKYATIKRNPNFEKYEWAMVIFLASDYHNMVDSIFDNDLDELLNHSKIIFEDGKIELSSISLNKFRMFMEERYNV